MVIGLGVLGFPPAHFWSLTLAEFLCAMEGWREANNTDQGKGKPLDSRSFEDLKAQFPDGRASKEEARALREINRRG